jgi:membrane protein YqaA with SNARE-associated domain
LGTLSNLFAPHIQSLYVALRQPSFLPVVSVFGVAFLDALIPLPGGMDGLVATAILATDGNLWMVATYIVLAAAGNAAGNTILYAIGYKGGEVLLEKRLGRERFAAMRAKFEKREVLSLMLAAMMPPPFPFKTLALAAAVFEVNFARFVLGILLGRLFRFSILSALVLTFGPQILGAVGALLRQNLSWILAAAASVLGLGLLLWKLRKTPSAPPATPR